MRRLLKGALGLGAAGLVAFGVSYGIARFLMTESRGGAEQQASPTNQSAIDEVLVGRGRYLARAGDCVACHTGPGDTEFAGGLAMATPMGTIYSTNITPDGVTGIGRYSYEDFVHAVQQGVAPGGRALYPAMPYPSYAAVTAADMRALYTYSCPGSQASAARTLQPPFRGR